MAYEIRTVGVIGLGTMGAGIVEVLARGGVDVVGVETTPELAERGRGLLERSTGRAVAKGRMSEQEQSELLGRVTFTADMAELAEADLVIEAVPEVLEIKRSIFARLDDIVRPDCVLASNTSSLSITTIAAGTREPRRVVGMHFFNPAPVLRLVEVITTLMVDEEVVAAVRALAERLGKTPIVVGDRAGFVANTLLFGYLNRAMSTLAAQVATAEDIDTAMRVGAGLPMGPFALIDLIGLDVCNEIGDVIHGFTHNAMHASSPMLAQMVTAGLLGRKSGRGFYSYETDSGVTAVDGDTGAGVAVTTRPVRTVGLIGAGEIAGALRGRLEEAGFQVLALASPEDDLATLADADLVIEAADELLDAGGELAGADGEGAAAEGDGGAAALDLHALFAELGEIARPGAVLASLNADAAIDLAAVSGRADSAVALRLHEPTPNGQLVEIARTSFTADDTLATLRQAFSAAGLTPVVCADRAGLIVDALLFPYLNEAVRMHEVGYASKDDIDTAMKHGCGYPAGPFEMLDHVGAGAALEAVDAVHTESGDPGLAPARLLVEHALLGEPFRS